MTVWHRVQVPSLDQASSCGLTSTEALRDVLPSDAGNLRTQNCLNLLPFHTQGASAVQAVSQETTDLIMASVFI